MADLGEKADGMEPLVLGELHVTRKCMQMLHEARHDGAQALVAAARHGREHGLSDGVFVDVKHGSPPQMFRYCNRAALREI